MARVGVITDSGGQTWRYEYCWNVGGHYRELNTTWTYGGGNSSSSSSSSSNIIISSSSIMVIIIGRVVVILVVGIVLLVVIVCSITGSSGWSSPSHLIPCLVSKLLGKERWTDILT